MPFKINRQSFVEIEVFSTRKLFKALYRLASVSYGGFAMSFCFPQELKIALFGAFVLGINYHGLYFLSLSYDYW